MSSKLNQMIASKYFSFFVTLALFVILYGAGMAIYKGFMRPQVFLNLFIDNAALIIVTIGITFTLIIAGIDLSVGAVLALVCMVLAWLLANTGIPLGWLCCWYSLWARCLVRYRAISSRNLTCSPSSSPWQACSSAAA